MSAHRLRSGLCCARSGRTLDPKGFDMTSGPEENAYERRIEQLLGELAQKQQFTMMVVHEMRNLIAPLADGVQLLEHDGSAASIEARPLIARQLSQMRRLVDDLLDIGCV